MEFVTHGGRIRFILVSPSHPGNIGAAARAIKTMGFDRLYVVNPRHEDYRENADALAFSTHAADVLNYLGTARSGSINFTNFARSII